MTARTGMSDLITALRGMANAGTLDYSIDSAAYWSDDQLQIILDRHRKEIYHEQLTPISFFPGGGSVQYFEYRSKRIHWEGGTAAFTVKDALGATIGTADYSVDYARGIITFGADVKGSLRYLTGRIYDLDGAAADVWRQKMAHTAKLYSFSAGGQSMTRREWFANCKEMAQIYESAAWPATVEIGRSDDL